MKTAESINPTAITKDTILLEAAHFYAGERLNVGYAGTNYGATQSDCDSRMQELNVGVDLGAELAQLLLRAGLKVSCCALADDTALKFEWKGKTAQGLVESRCLGNTQQQIQDAGLILNQTFREADFLDAALEMVTRLRVEAIKSADWRIVALERKLENKKSGKVIKLLGKDGNLDMPSCDVLDLCIYREKLRHCDITVTLLPDSYLGQQERVRNLFHLLGESPAVVLVRHDQHGNLVGVDSWNPSKTTQVVELLKPLVKVS